MLKNIAITLTSRCSIIAAALIISVLTARFLGPEGRGYYFYIYSLVGILAQLSMLGLQTSNTYLATANPQLLNKLTINSAWISFLFCTLLALMVAIVFYLQGNAVHGYIGFVVILTPPYLFYLLGTSLFVSVGKIKQLNYYQLLTNLLTVMAVFLAGYYTKNLYVIFWLVFCAWIIVAISMFFSLCNNHEKCKWTFDYTIFRVSFLYSFKAFIITTCTLAVLRTNVFLLEFLSFTEVGYFSIAAQIADALSLLPTTVALLLFPQLINAKTTDLSVTLSVLKKVGALILVLALLIGFLAPFFIPLLFGVEFMPAVDIIRCLLPGSFFSCLIVILSQYLAARGLPLILVFIWLAGVLVNVILSYELMRHYGAVGAASGLSMSYALILLACGMVVRVSR